MIQKKMVLGAVGIFIVGIVVGQSFGGKNLKLKGELSSSISSDSCSFSRCPAGWSNIGDSCVQSAPAATCPSGWMVVGDECVDIPCTSSSSSSSSITCGDGQILCAGPVSICCPSTNSCGSDGMSTWCVSSSSSSSLISCLSGAPPLGSPSCDGGGPTCCPDFSCVGGIIGCVPNYLLSSSSISMSFGSLSSMRSSSSSSLTVSNCTGLPDGTPCNTLGTAGFCSSSGLRGRPTCVIPD